MPGVIDTTYTFTSTDLVTSAKMNNILDQSVFNTGAITGTTLAVSSGMLKVATGGITANEIAANAVVTAGILDANVTTAKIADGSITTAKIVDGAVTTAKIADGAITAAKLAGATISAVNLSGGQTGDAPIYGARAWGHFGALGGLLSTGGNIASVTKTATGRYTVTFTVAMPNALYAAIVTPGGIASSNNGRFACEVVSRSASAFNFATFKVTDGSEAGQLTDMSTPGSLVIFG